MVLAFCLDSRDPDLLQLFEDLRGRQMQTSELAQINGRCVAIGAQRHLTPREIEVMQNALRQPIAQLHSRDALHFHEHSENPLGSAVQRS